jgi:hypothetical protein
VLPVQRQGLLKEFQRFLRLAGVAVDTPDIHQCIAFAHLVLECARRFQRLVEQTQRLLRPGRVEGFSALIQQRLHLRVRLGLCG